MLAHIIGLHNFTGHVMFFTTCVYHYNTAYIYTHIWVSTYNVLELLHICNVCSTQLLQNVLWCADVAHINTPPTIECNQLPLIVMHSWDRTMHQPHNPAVLNRALTRPSRPIRYNAPHVCQNSASSMTGDLPLSHITGMPQVSRISLPTLLCCRCTCCCSSLKNLHATAFAV